MLKKSLILTVLLLVFSSQYLAADGLYSKIGIGYSMPSKQDVESHSTNGIDFKNGAEIQLAVGYKMDSFRFEGEYSYSKFSMDKLYTSSASRYIDDVMKIHSLLANAIYDFNINFPFKPYIGAGLGMSQVRWDGKTIHYSDKAFTYQGFFGVTYAVNNKINFDIQYKYKDIGKYSLIDISGGKGTMTNNTFNSLNVAIRYSF